MGRVVRWVVVVAGLLLVFVTATAVAATPFERPDAAERELVGKRTPQSRTWELPSGKRVTQAAAGPVQWLDAGGAWHDYDLSLRRDDAGWDARPGRVAIELPQELSVSKGGAVEVADGAGSVLSMSFIGERASGTVADGVVTYAGVAEGVELRMRAVPGGLKEDIVLRDAKASRDLSYRMTVNRDDLALEETEAGGLRAMRGKETVFVIPAPVLVDDEGAPGLGGRFELREEGERSWVVSTVLPQRWLDAPGRAWPVVVDPSVLSFSAAANDDCEYWVMSGAPDPLVYSACGMYEARSVGHIPDDWEWDAFSSLRFDTLTADQTERIQDATLRLHVGATSSGEINVHRMLERVIPPLSRAADVPRLIDAAPTAVMTPTLGWSSVDVTNVVDQWRRWEESDEVAGYPNRGILLRHAASAPWANPNWCLEHQCDLTSYASSQYPDPYYQPVLEVTSWPAAPAGSAVISPGEGDLTGKRVPLQARALSSSVTSVRFQYIAGSQRRWTDIPNWALNTPTRGILGGGDIPVSGPSGDRRSDLVIWDVTAMRGGEVDGPVHVRAWLESATSGGGMTDEVNFRLDRRGIDKSPTVPIGPGELSLLSGEFTMQETDASAEAFLQDLTLTRTYHSRGVAVRNADMFGSGWEGSVAADGGELPYKGIYNFAEVRDVAVDRQILDPSNWDWELFYETYDFEDLGADIETVQEIERFDYEYAVVEAGDGTKMTFTQIKNSRGEVTDWTSDDLHPGFNLTRTSTVTPGVFEFRLTEPGGSVATFRSEAASSPNYRMTTFAQPGSASQLSYVYESAGTRQRLTRVIEPAPPGGATRSLVFTWDTVDGFSEVQARVVSVALESGGVTTTVARYDYDTNGRLIQVTDPRIGGGVRNTRYHYNAGGQLDQVTPSGEATWNLAYTTASGDRGPRLGTVSRAHPDGGNATQTVRYNVAIVSPSSGLAAPYELTTAETAKWGQVDDLPWDAVAIWPEDTIPSGRRPYPGATIYYLGRQGLTVNVARPGGAISTYEHDANGNVIRSLSAQGRAVALAAGARSVDVANDRSTLYGYAGNGVDLTSTREPVTQITLADGRVVTGRRVSLTHYDVGAPTGGPYHLPTSRRRQVESGGSVYDQRELVRYGYEGEGGMSGWTARHATKTVVDPAGKALTSYSILHDRYPIVEETRTPGRPNGSTSPDVQWYQYYGIRPARVPAGIQDAGQCKHGAGDTPPQYASGLLCERSEATTPTASIPRRWFTYTEYGRVARLQEARTLAAGGPTYRATTNTYNTADELTETAVTGGAGTATPTATFTYDPATGQQTQARSSAGTITRTFDSNGRPSQYTDASGTVTDYRYDLRGRTTSMTVDSVTTTFGYDDHDNRTSVNDAGVGAAITATYDLDDKLAGEALPNGLVSMQSYDETGRPSVLSWTQTDPSCRSSCVWARSEITNRDADGRTVGQRTNTTQETLTYDTAGRLTRSEAVRLSDNRCVRRTYEYDGGGSGDSNRTSSSVWAPGFTCGRGSPTTRSLTYDDADRITSSGWTWDDFGRATNVPAADSGGTGALAAGYFTNDRVRELTLDGRTHTYGRDPLDRTQTIASSGASKPTLTSTYRYGDDTDEPARITLSNGTVTRDVEGPGGDVVASVVNGTPTYQLRDIMGSIVANAPASGPLSAATEYDPFGIVTTAAPNVIDNRAGLPANGWLGSHQRPTQFGQDGVDAGGPIEMGVRVYLPKVGRFLQVDSVDGGSANQYDYVHQDPTNLMDLDGEAACNPSVACCKPRRWLEDCRDEAKRGERCVRLLNRGRLRTQGRYGGNVRG